MQLDLASWEPVREVEEDSGVVLRQPDRSDIPALGMLYFAAYEPGLVGADVDEATDDIVASYNGDYGEFWGDASAVAGVSDELVGALLTVKQAPWADTPRVPFIIELFVAPDLRRKGIARRLLDHSLGEMKVRGVGSVALRVGTGNRSARRLYQSVGFVDWAP